MACWLALNQDVKEVECHAVKKSYLIKKPKVENSLEEFLKDSELTLNKITISKIEC